MALRGYNELDGRLLIRTGRGLDETAQTLRQLCNLTYAARVDGMEPKQVKAFDAQLDRVQRTIEAQEAATAAQPRVVRSDMNKLLAAMPEAV